MIQNNSDASLSVVRLEKHPEHAAAVADWIMSEWGRLPIHDYFDATGRGERWRTPLPRTLIAMLGGELVGTASVLLNDLEMRPELNPWFGCLYVAPAFRRRGIGSRLIDEAQSLAANDLGITRIFLFTEHDARLYAQHGWETVESDQDHGKPITIMTRLLAPRVTKPA